MTPTASASSAFPLALILHDAHAERVYYALSLAAAALTVDTPVTLFFTMQACRVLVADGNHVGWQSLPSQTLGSATAMDADYRAKGLAGVEELLLACRDLGARFMVCESGLRAAGLDTMTLRTDIPIVEGGLVTLLSTAHNARITMI